MPQVDQPPYPHGPVRFEDLTSAQIRAMTRLEGWSSDGSPIGYLEDMLPAELLEAVLQMERMGLARVDTGWRDARWWHLTDRGRRVREHGEA